MKTLEIYETLDSTQTFLKQKLNHEGFSFCTILAYHQTQGKGRYERHWESPAHESLLMSMSYRLPDREICQEWHLTYLIALTLHFSLEKWGVSSCIKWPNDLYVKDQKIAGILIEKIKNDYVIGVGVNLNQASFEGHLQKATSYYLQTQKKMEILEFFNTFNSQWESIEKLWMTHSINIPQEIESRLYARHQRIAIWNSSFLAEGIFFGISHCTGALLLKNDQEELKEFYVGSLSKL